MVSRFCTLCLPLACALLAACSSMPAAPDSKQAAQRLRDQREKAMHLAWVGHPYEELVMTLGPPGMIMNIPAYRPWKASVVVYEKLDTASGCIDAFDIEHAGTPVVYDYFCR